MPRTLNECPVVVYTNTNKDYRIVVGDEWIDKTVADRINRTVAPAFAKAVEARGFEAAVGAMHGSDADNLLAFRVFDVGTFKVRKHTIGFVGILVPRQPMRGWPLSAVLSRLPAPPPGDPSYNYVLPSIELTCLPPCNDPPFNAIDEWEATDATVPSKGAVCFCHPASPCPRIIPWKEPPSEGPSGGPGPVRRIAKLLAILATGVVLLAIAVLLTLRGDQLPPVRDPPPIPRPPEDRTPPTTGPSPPASNDPARRVHEDEDEVVEGSLLVEAMRRAYFQVSDFGTDVSEIEKLRGQTAGAADQARKNLTELGEVVQFQRKRGASAEKIVPTIKGHLGEWKRKSSLSPKQGISREEARKAREFLNHYFELLQQMQEFIDAPDDVRVSALEENLNDVLHPKSSEPHAPAGDDRPDRSLRRTRR